MALRLRSAFNDNDGRQALLQLQARGGVLDRAASLGGVQERARLRELFGNRDGQRLLVVLELLECRLGQLELVLLDVLRDLIELALSLGGGHRRRGGRARGDGRRCRRSGAGCVGGRRGRWGGGGRGGAGRFLAIAAHCQNSAEQSRCGEESESRHEGSPFAA